MRWLTRATSIAVVLIIIAASVLWIRSRIPKQSINGGFVTFAKFRDGSKLALGSPVIIAGVRVGQVERLTVEGRFARVDMRLQDGLDLPVESFATKKADTLFGDSYVEIIPAAGDEGAGTAAHMKSGDQIAHVVEGGSTDSVLRAIDTGLPKIDNALEIVHGAVITARKWVGGPMDERLTAGADWLNKGRIEGPTANVDQALVRIEDLSTRGADAVAAQVPAVAKTLERVDHNVATARDRLRESKADLIEGFANAREGLNNIDPQIDQAGEIVAAIDQGSGNDWKGTLGRLVNKDDVADTLEDVTAAGREATASFNRFKTWLGMRVEFDVFSRAVRFYATAEIRARNDKFYLIEFERGPLGGVPNDTISDVVGDSDYIRQQEIHDQLRFTAQFGKQLGPIALRGGLKDSTFGAGIDALMMAGRLKLSVDLYGSFQRTPRLKVAGALEVFRSIYVLAGVDDALNKPGYLSIISGGQQTAPSNFSQLRYGRDYFVGTMLVFDDADISVLLRVYGALLVGLL